MTRIRRIGKGVQDDGLSAAKSIAGSRGMQASRQLLSGGARPPPFRRKFPHRQIKLQFCNVNDLRLVLRQH
jgi:hypothetical protein